MVCRCSLWRLSVAVTIMICHDRYPNYIHNLLQVKNNLTFTLVQTKNDSQNFFSL